MAMVSNNESPWMRPGVKKELIISIKNTKKFNQDFNEDKSVKYTQGEQCQGCDTILDHVWAVIGLSAVEFPQGLQCQFAEIYPNKKQQQQQQVVEKGKGVKPVPQFHRISCRTVLNSERIIEVAPQTCSLPRSK